MKITMPNLINTLSTPEKLPLHNELKYILKENLYFNNLAFSRVALSILINTWNNHLTIFHKKMSHHKPSISSHSKPRTRSRTKLLKCVALQHSIIKTTHLRSLIQGLIRGFEWLEILGFININVPSELISTHSRTKDQVPWADILLSKIAPVD